MKTYEQVHAGLVYVRGRARDQICECGSPARDWAYQHNAGVEEQVSEWGAPYSENLLEHYAPMCRPCHSRLDWTTGSSGRLVEARRRNGAAVGSDPRHLEGRRIGGERGAATLQQRFLDDPDFAARCREARSKNGNEALARNNELRFLCECGRPMSLPNLRRHQAASGCSTHVDLEAGVLASSSTLSRERACHHGEVR